MPHLNFLSGSPLDRREDLRSDPDALERLLTDGVHRVVPVRGDKLPVWRDESVRAAFVEGALAGTLVREWPVTAFLGEVAGERFWMVDLDADALPDGAVIPGEMAGLRSVGAVLDRMEAAVLAQARALAHFHRQHAYCGVCGGGTIATDLGNARRCTSADCEVVFYPRSDPAMITLLQDDRERCLLIRQPEWPAKVYATVAGFVEPGESLEDAVRREVTEETGLEVVATSYHSSQPWPFPSSIMIGFMTSVRGTVAPNPRELEDARWFTRGELEAAVAEGEIILPSAVSISRALIGSWLQRQE